MRESQSQVYTKWKVLLFPLWWSVSQEIIHRQRDRVSFSDAVKRKINNNVKSCLLKKDQYITQCIHVYTECMQRLYTHRLDEKCVECHGRLLDADVSPSLSALRFDLYNTQTGVWSQHWLTDRMRFFSFGVCKRSDSKITSLHEHHWHIRHAAAG